MRIRHYRRAHERRAREPGAKAAPALLAGAPSGRFPEGNDRRAWHTQRYKEAGYRAQPGWREWHGPAQSRPAPGERERPPSAEALAGLSRASGLARLVEEQRAAALATLRARLVNGTYEVDSLRLARHLLGMASD